LWIDWRKASLSFSSGNCVTVAGWRAARASGMSECVEAGTGPAMVGVRDSKNAGGPVLRYSPEQWRAFCARMR
jgi:hypothetical protein